MSPVEDKGDYRPSFWGLKWTKHILKTTLLKPLAGAYGFAFQQRAVKQKQKKQSNINEQLRRFSFSTFTDVLL